MTWQNSRSIDQRHVHTPVRDNLGQMVCTSCRQIVLNPITSSDDPRLHQAGFMRTGGNLEFYKNTLALMFGAQMPFLVATFDLYCNYRYYEGEPEDLFDSLATKLFD